MNAFKWMLRLNFVLGIWRNSLDKLFQILTPVLEKGIFCLYILEYARKMLPLQVDDAVLYEWITKLLILDSDILFETSCIKMATDLNYGRWRGRRLEEMKRSIAWVLNPQKNHEAKGTSLKTWDFVPVSLSCEAPRSYTK